MHASPTTPVLLSLLFMLPWASVALATDDPANPRAWRPMVVTDLKLPGPASSVYAQLWADLIARNNEISTKSGARRLVGNAPIREAHVVVRNATTVATLSILYAPALCQPHNGSPQIQTCPLRIVVHRNGGSTIREAVACFAAMNPSEGTGNYASYDVESRTIRIGTLLRHDAVEGCSKNIPVSEVR
jgi:hypothetical protein